MFLRGGFTATGVGDDRYGPPASAPASAASFECDGASLRNDSGPALIADGLQVDQTCSCAADSPPPAPATIGAVRLPAPASAATSTATGASLRNDSGPALNADGLQVEPGHVPARRVHRHRRRRRSARSAWSAPTSAASSTATGRAAQRLRPRPGRRRPAGRPGLCSSAAGSPPPAAATVWRSI